MADRGDWRRDNINQFIQELRDSLLIETPHIARFTFLVFILGIAAVLANRFVRVHARVEELNENLEQKVEDRTRQLQESLTEVNALKEKQDGDYFLTSLLIKPLGGNFVESKNVNIDMVISQKKKFQFKKWQAEIGGDLCVAHQIELQGKRYTTFLNGDAMGKSIQGAGGALVLGTVFKSIINRTHTSEDMNKKTPERWMKDAFLELQEIFLGFDGTMLISVVMGLLDESNGLVYYVNAEHPLVVLYRDKKASFVENQLILRKIGVQGIDAKFQVQTFQMRPGDVLITGSDGRDDVIIGTDDGGHRLINEDVARFLENTEKGQGQLAAIYDRVADMGELSDDFTLMRIGYREGQVTEKIEWAEQKKFIGLGLQHQRNGQYQKAIKEFEAALGLNKDDGRVLRALGDCYRVTKEYEKAYSHYHQGVALNPASMRALYSLALMAKRTRRFSEAIEAGERVRLRDPKHVKNLLNLADAWRLKKNLTRAKKILNEALSLDADNKKAAELLSVMSS